MSALGQKADVSLSLADVRFTPESGHRNSVVEVRLFDHLNPEGRTAAVKRLRCPHQISRFQFGTNANHGMHYLRADRSHISSRRPAGANRGC